MEDASPKSCTACGSWWRLPLLLGLVLVAIMLGREHLIPNAPLESGDKATTDPADSASRASVSLVIDFGNGRRRDFGDIVWHEGMMVADLFSGTKGVAVTKKGSGQAAFLTAIDGIANEGAAGSNWTYSVNGQSGDRSFAVYELHPGERVLWTFGPRR